MGVVTGKGLADLIREEYGFRITFILMVILLLADLGNTIAEFAGLASGMSVFGSTASSPFRWELCSSGLWS